MKIHLHCFGGSHQEIQLFSTFLWVARIEVPLAVPPACWESSQHQSLEKLPLKHIWRTCSNTGTVCVLLCNQFICPRRLLYLVCTVRDKWRSSFEFLCTGILSDYWIALSWVTSMLDPDSGSFIQRILCPVKSTLFQSSEPTSKSFLSLARTRCYISIPPVPKRSSTKRFTTPATKIWLLDFLHCDPAFSEMLHLLLTSHAIQLKCCLCCATVQSIFGSRFAHASGLNTTHNSIGQLAWEPCPNCTVPCPQCSTSVEGHHSYRVPVSSILQQCKEDDLLLVAFDTQHHDSHHKIDVKGVPTLYLASHPKFGFCRSRRMRLLILPLFVLETSQCPSCFCFEEVSLFVRLDDEHPSSGLIISRFNLPRVTKIKNLVINPGFVLQVFCFRKLIVVSSYFSAETSFRTRDFLSALIPAALPQVVIHRSNASRVRQSTPSVTSVFVLPELLVISLRYNHRCAQGIVIKLYMSYG